MKYLIIGAGPAGMATAVALQKANLDFEIVDAGNKFGGIWDIERSSTPMYRSAHFISSKTLSGFKDFPMPDDYPDYPNHQLVQSYLEAYAEQHQLGASAGFNQKVVQVDHQEEGWEVSFGDGRKKWYEGIICATGITWHLNEPSIKGDFAGEMLHSFHYKDEDYFKGKKVLVIGAGNSGCDIACDAARVAEKAFISLRRGYYFLPKYIMGIPADVFKQRYALPNLFLDRTVSEFLLNKVLVGNLENYGLPRPDHRLLESHPIMNSRLLHYLGHGDISAKTDVVRLDGQSVVFADGTTEEVDLIVTATGYKRIFPFFADHIIEKKENDEIDLHLEIFSKKYDSLFFVGGIEVSSAVFGLFSLQGEIVAAYLKAQRKENLAYQNFIREKRWKKLNLRGQNRYIDSMRHQRYVDKNRYSKLLDRQIKSFE